MEQSSQTKLLKKQVGDLGEQIAARYLKHQGYEILEMNYWKKWGEIDVIAKKNDRVHFIEVKSVSYETKGQLKQAVLHGTWRPEENVHESKLRKLSHVIETWLIDKKCDFEWQIDVAAVRLVPRETFATVKMIENVIIE